MNKALTLFVSSFLAVISISAQNQTFRVDDPATADQLISRGGKLLADYGSFKLILAATNSITPGSKHLASMEEDNFIELHAGPLDTRSAAAKAMRKAVAKSKSSRMHLVQFIGPIKPEWYADLQQTGVRIVTHIPQNAYLVFGNDTSLGRLQSWAATNPLVQWEGPYADDFKINPAARATNAQGQARWPGTASFAIQLVDDAGLNSNTLAQVDALKLSPIERETRVLGYRNIFVELPPDKLPELATNADVVSIQPYFPRKKYCERQAQIMAGNLSGNVPSGPGYLAWLASKGFTQAQFDASGFVVDVTDSGIDNGTTSPNHFGLHRGGTNTLAGRVAYNRLEGTPNPGSTLQGCDGHGNLNAHIIGGYDDFSGSPFADSSGYHYGLGICPFVKVGSSVIFDVTNFTSPNYNNLASRAYRDGARVSNNSWGADTAGAYDADAQNYDALVRDAQPSGSSVPVAGNQEMVFVFAAGNAGSGAKTVGSPGTGKNIICVGAAENVQAFGGSDGSGIADSGANSANDVISFSSRGPCSDGRFKPDLCAPGTHVSGGVAQVANPSATGTAIACFDGTGVSGGTGGSSYFPSGQQFYTASSGTSHSTPGIAGACALLRQYFINQSLTPPSPAMTKAYLVNSTRYMTGTGAGGTLPSNSQGMGSVNLGTAFDGVSRILRDELAADLFTATGQVRTNTGNVADASKPFRVTLAWTDAPGNTTGNAYNNNLDLAVTVGGVIYKGNVFSGSNSVTGGTNDIKNNLECVFVPAGVTGPFTVTVSAANITSDGVPGNASALDQDYALVIYNALDASGPPTIQTPPASRTNAYDTTATFNVIASGTTPLSYQWYFSTTAISDATNSTLTISNVTAASEGNYFVIVTNPLGSVTSVVASLTVSFAPVVTGFAPSYGLAGNLVNISGLLFSNVTGVSFNGVAAGFNVNSATSLTANVPAGSGTGPITVTTLYGTANSSSNFVILAGDGSPVINSFNPATALTNTSVTLYGTNFAAVSGVAFNGQSATYTVDSIAQITAQVPVGATDGFISVTNVYGVGTSATAFIVATNPVSPVHISQIYGSGGLAGALYQNDYVELHNASGSSVDLSTWSLQYAAYTGTSWTKLNLTGSILPGRYFLVQLAGGTTGSALPTADLSSTVINMSATRGKIALLSTQTTIASGTSTPIGVSGLEDFVGFGGANAYEGSAAAPAISATTADFRLGNGAIDTDDNAADFIAATPNPRNSSYALPAADLAVLLTHTGNFIQGDTNDAYTITVTNVGGLASSGTVTVVDTLPAGLTAIAISGNGWSTNLASLTCTRNDSLAAGAAFPPITLTVTVATNAASSVTNIATVSGGSDSNSTNNTAYDPTTILSSGVNQLPVVTTLPAGGVTSGGATLNGSLIPGGLVTTAQFQYGQTTNYGTTINLSGTFTGTNSIAVTTNITGLSAGTTYHFRLIATNAAGLAVGVDQAFTTTPVSSGGTSFAGVLAGWDVNGSTGPGTSPYLPSSNAPNVSVTGIIRGSGLSTSATASRAWGANGWSTTTAAAGITAIQYITFSLTLTNGSALTISNFNRFDYRRSSSGPASGLLQVQVGNGTFIDLTNLSFASSANAGASIGPVDLSWSTALQNIPAGTTVTFRLVNYAATGSTGTWYIYDVANSTALDFSISGSVTAAVTGTPPAISLQPVSTNTYIGRSATLNVNATGTAPLSYRWLKAGTAFTDGGGIVGSTTNTLNFSPATNSHSGNYSVVITNIAGAVTSSVASLAVVPLPQLTVSNSPSGLYLTAVGAISNAVIVQRATNLQPPLIWLPVETNVIGADGIIRFSETNYVLPASFYRLLIP